MTNEVQRLDFVGGGAGPPKTFTLSFMGTPTDPISYQQATSKPTVADIQSALDALPTIGPGNVVVSSDVAWGFVLSFQGALGDNDLGDVTADDSQISASIVCSTVTHGSPPIDPGEPPVYSLPLPVTLHRLDLALQRAHAITPGVAHAVVVSTDGTNLILSPAL